MTRGLSVCPKGVSSEHVVFSLPVFFSKGNGSVGGVRRASGTDGAAEPSSAWPTSELTVAAGEGGPCPHGQLPTYCTCQSASLPGGRQPEHRVHPGVCKSMSPAQFFASSVRN